MKRLLILAVCWALAALVGVSPAEAKCTTRRLFKFEIKRSLDTGDTGVELKDASGQGLGCFILTDKSKADLCAGADGGIHLFQVMVHNRCDKPIEGTVLVRQPSSYPLEFDADDSCKAALTTDGYKFSLAPNRPDKVLCHSKPYEPDNSGDPDYTASYSIAVTSVNGQAPTNGLFDPRIAVERDGDVSTGKHEWPTLFAVSLLALGLGAVLGWVARSRRQRAGV